MTNEEPRQKPKHNIINDTVITDIFITLRVPKRVYEISWAVSKLKGYDSLDSFVQDIFLEDIQMYLDGRSSLDDDTYWSVLKEEEDEKKEDIDMRN